MICKTYLITAFIYFCLLVSVENARCETTIKFHKDPNQSTFVCQGSTDSTLNDALGSIGIKPTKWVTGVICDPADIDHDGNLDFVVSKEQKRGPDSGLHKFKYVVLFCGAGEFKNASKVLAISGSYHYISHGDQEDGREGLYVVNSAGDYGNKIYLYDRKLDQWSTYKNESGHRWSRYGESMVMYSGKLENEKWKIFKSQMGWGLSYPKSWNVSVDAHSEAVSLTGPHLGYFTVRRVSEDGFRRTEVENNLKNQMNIKGATAYHFPPTGELGNSGTIQVKRGPGDCFNIQYGGGATITPYLQATYQKMVSSLIFEQ